MTSLEELAPPKYLYSARVINSSNRPLAVNVTYQGTKDFTEFTTASPLGVKRTCTFGRHEIDGQDFHIRKFEIFDNNNNKKEHVAPFVDQPRERETFEINDKLDLVHVSSR